MSVHVMSWVLRHSEERLGRRLVLLVLADHASEDGTGAWPSVATIAREARMSESQTRECLRKLESSGAITATGKHKTGTNVYDVVMTGAPESGGGRNPGEGGRESGPEPSLEPSDSSTATSVSVSRAPGDSYDPRKGQKIDGRNLPWDALVEVTQADEQVEKGRIAQALKLIRGYMGTNIPTPAPAEATEQWIAEEIRDRAARYRHRWPNVELTPTALASNWSRVLTEAPGRASLDGLQRAEEIAQRAIDHGRES